MKFVGDLQVERFDALGMCLLLCCLERPNSKAKFSSENSNEMPFPAGAVDISVAIDIPVYLKKSSESAIRS